MWILASSSYAFARTSFCRQFLAHNLENKNKKEEKLDFEVWKSFARKAVAHSDFKYISDLVPKNLNSQEKNKIFENAKSYRSQIYQNLVNQKNISPVNAQKLSQTAYARYLLNNLFEFPRELSFVNPQILGPQKQLVPTSETKSGLPFSELNLMFEGLEKTWPFLVRQTNPTKGGSLVAVKKPILIAGGRFREGYYWDTFFGSLGLILTGRRELVTYQLQNFVELINTHGLIPNGLRTYYLSRSQPPVVSLLMQILAESSKWQLNTVEQKQFNDWLVKEVYPALKSDYQNFWMTERFDPKTGLNFYSDRLNAPRPERHSNDNEKKLGKTYRDVRAEAESGLDHTNLFQGQASQIATVSLNSFMFAYEKNLSWLAELAKDFPMQLAFEKAAQQRQEQMTKHMWNSQLGLFQNYHLREGQLMPGVSGDVFSVLYTQLATKTQAVILVPKALEALERDGGIAASTLKDGKQWDGDMGWAPFQIMAIQGLDNYGFKIEATRLAGKWVRSNLNAFNQHGQFFEKLDINRLAAPIEDGSKYPTQTGFLWTNSSVVFALNYLGYDFK